MILVVGLGNPGAKYTYTRHNIGFIAIDYMINRYNLKEEQYKKSDLILAKGQILDANNNSTTVVFAKPQTYMNLSGQAVTSLASYYKIHINKILVIHDDVDLEFGKTKFKIGGGNAGHNGLKSLDQHIGNNYCRLRIGIGKPPIHIDLADYVLSKFTDTELDNLNHIVKKITDNLNLFFAQNIEQFQKIINSN